MEVLLVEPVGTSINQYYSDNKDKILRETNP